MDKPRRPTNGAANDVFSGDPIAQIDVPHQQHRRPNTFTWEDHSTARFLEEHDQRPSSNTQSVCGTEFNFPSESSDRRAMARRRQSAPKTEFRGRFEIITARGGRPCATPRDPTAEHDSSGDSPTHAPSNSISQETVHKGRFEVIDVEASNRQSSGTSMPRSAMAPSTLPQTEVAGPEASNQKEGRTVQSGRFVISDIGLQRSGAPAQTSTPNSRIVQSHLSEKRNSTPTSRFEIIDLDPHDVRRPVLRPYKNRVTKSSSEERLNRYNAAKAARREFPTEYDEKGWASSLEQSTSLSSAKAFGLLGELHDHISRLIQENHSLQLANERLMEENRQLRNEFERQR